jgi:hypothetical protein
LNTWKIPAMGQVHSQQLIHWATPQASDYVEGARTAKGSRQKCLGRDLKELGSGTDVSGSPAATEKPGRLNPELSRWLMGFPAGWSCLKATATIVPQVAAEFIKACIDSLLGVPKTKNQALGQRAGLGSHLQTVRNSGRSVWQDGRHS